jgi:hypothetical protein
MSSGTGTPFGKGFMNAGYAASAEFTIGAMRSMRDLKGFVLLLEVLYQLELFKNFGF